MAKRNRKELDFNSLEGRLLFIFREKKDYEIGEILSCKRETVSGWRSGKSKPTLEHIIKTVDVSYVDSDWILTGQTQSITSIIHVFFPIFFDENRVKDQHSYELARDFAGYAIAHRRSQEDLDAGIHTSAAFLRHAISEDAPDPEEEMICRFADQPDMTDYISYALKVEVPKGFLSLQTKNIKTMISFIEPKENNTYINTLNPEDRKNLPSAHSKPTIHNPNQPTNFYEIPYFPDGIAAGNPKEISDHPDGVVILHKDWCSHPLETSAARLSDKAHSMEPTIMAGSIITVDHSMTNPKELDGEVVAIHKKDDGITVKRLKKIGKRWCGAPDNPDYDIIEIEEGDHIVGLVTTHHNRITNKR